jgi:hypothetical protein
MLYLFRLLFLFINIDQETVLNWFGMEDPTNQQMRQVFNSGADLNLENLEPSPNVSFETLRIIMEGLGEKIQDGLTLADIENILFFVLFFRFIILAIRYNLKTSFYITCIGLLAGYFWYRHLIDLISMYRSVLLKLPVLHQLGIDAVQLRSLQRQMVLTDLKSGEMVHWYTPGQMLYSAFAKGIINFDFESGLPHYIDPLSMFISNLPEPVKSRILPLYYNIYHIAIPKVIEIFTSLWAQFSGIAAYVLITRLGKRYCPYLIRWHWTFLLILGLVETMVTSLINRINYFKVFVLIPQTKSSLNYVDPSVILQINLLTGLITGIVLIHIGFIIFGLFHAICGQYFYVPFLVDNTELHVGPRPANSIYSGGYTAWQDPKENEQQSNRWIPKVWYGWFGRGTTKKSSGNKSWIQFLKKFSRTFKKFFRR